MFVFKLCPGLVHFPVPLKQAGTDVTQQPPTSSSQHLAFEDGKLDWRAWPSTKNTFTGNLVKAFNKQNCIDDKTMVEFLQAHLHAGKEYLWVVAHLVVALGIKFDQWAEDTSTTLGNTDLLALTRKRSHTRIDEDVAESLALGSRVQPASTHSEL
eukprot:5776418-Amphidinium_carterae.1